MSELQTNSSTNFDPARSPTNQMGGVNEFGIVITDQKGERKVYLRTNRQMVK